MREALWWMRVAVWTIGLAACGSSPHAGDDDGGGGDDGGIDGTDGDAAVTTPASCVGLPATCGPSGAEDCCKSLEVAGGMYYRSYDILGDGNSGNMASPAIVSSFHLDKYEVTVGRFRAFVQAGMGTQASPPGAGAGAHAMIADSGWSANWNTRLVASTVMLAAALKCNATFQTWTDTPGANEGRPVSCLTWYEAMAFCAWDGGFLPTEAEWNYAAAGGDQQRGYPWMGSVVDGMHASYYDGTNCVGDGAAGCTLADLVAVGTKPDGDGRWGQSDLAGNVSEWTLDSISLYKNPCMDCADLSDSTRVVRGGNFGQTTFYLRTANRSSASPTTRSHGFGVRCARAR